MSRVLVHALAATSGGGLTYLRNLLRWIVDAGGEHQWFVLVSPGLSVQLPEANHLTYLDPRGVGSGLRRALFDQVELRRLISTHRIDLLLATANFGMIRPPVPQILLNRNALYFSSDHIRELRRRRAVRELLQTLFRRQIAVASIRSSAINVVPTAAFAEEIQEWLSPRDNVRFEVVPFGFDHAGFAKPVDEFNRETLRSRLSKKPGVRRILLVSHYNYFRNFDTVLRAIAILKGRLTEPVELILTTKLKEGHHEHRYDTSDSARLVSALGLTEDVTMLGNVSHDQLPCLYGEADIVVCASYAESFGHPMVEAMACGRPLVVADRGVHREICRDAALSFSTFDAESLAYRFSQILNDRELAYSLGEKGRRRAADFSWNQHFKQFLGLVELALKDGVHAHVE